MRFFVVFVFILFFAGCSVTKQPAELLSVPLKPTLKSQSFELNYETTHEPPKIKSVQLPAHPIRNNQTVKVTIDNASATDTLITHVSKALTNKQLKVTTNNDSDYILIINQVDLSFTNDSVYTLIKPDGAFEHFFTISQQYPTQQCTNILAQVSMRLTHRKSGDVVWFATSSLNSASFHQEPLKFSFTEQKKITNELDVVAFIHQQNTEQARLARANMASEVLIPKYKTINKLSSLTKLQGPCTRTEISALTPNMQFYLSDILIDKIKVL